MKTYIFSVYLTSIDGLQEVYSHSVKAPTYQKAYTQLLSEIPHNYIYEECFVSPAYYVNGKKRFCK